MDWVAQLDPAYAARAEVRRLSVGEESTLSVKVKEFVVMGVLASRGLQYGVAAHMRRAIEYGATKEELFEAIKAAAVPGGGMAYSVEVRALQALEQERAFPRPSLSSPSRRQRGKASPPHQRPAGGAKRPHDERRPAHCCEKLRLRGKAAHAWHCNPCCGQGAGDFVPPIAQKKREETALQPGAREQHRVACCSGPPRTH